MTAPYYAVGKQILQGSADVAQARNNETAQLIVDALNEHVALTGMDAVMPELMNAADGLPEPQLVAGVMHSIRREGDEYVCLCTVRWGTDEGQDHP